MHVKNNALLNVDLKLLAKILANRMRPLLSKIIGPEQGFNYNYRTRTRTGFMPGQEARDNITKALNLIHHAKNSKIKGLLLYTDAEKAFVRVSWDYMLATC